MKCQSCGKDIDKSAFPGELVFCPYCGDKLNTGKMQFCPYCGQKLEAAANFCPHCGKKLASATTKTGGTGGEESKDFLEDAAKSIARGIRNTFGRERKVRKLYQQWAEFSDLPPEEVPSIDELKKISAEEKGRGANIPDDED